ncbi:MAG: glycosyltransferase [Chloroflexota bacterium]
MKVVYCLPHPQTVYAARFLHDGLRNAFLDLGHEFTTFTADDDLERMLRERQPDVFMYSLNFYHRRYVDLALLRAVRERGMVLFALTRAWNRSAGFLTNGSIAASDLRSDRHEVQLIRDGLAGDVFWNWIPRDHALLDGFEATTGARYEQIMLAADTTTYWPEFDSAWESDLAYVGANLAAKRRYFNACIRPLGTAHDLQVYGSDWTLASRALGHMQRLGQYLNIRALAGLREPQLSIADELPIARDAHDWDEMVGHFLAQPDERQTIATRGRDRVLAAHTYHHRVQQILGIVDEVRAMRAMA